MESKGSRRYGHSNRTRRAWHMASRCCDQHETPGESSLQPVALLLPPSLACYYGSPPGVPPHLAQPLAREPSRRLLAPSWLSQVKRRAPKRNARWIPPLQPSKVFARRAQTCMWESRCSACPSIVLVFLRSGCCSHDAATITTLATLLLRWSARENRVSHPRFPSPSNQHTTKYFRHPSPRPAVGFLRCTHTY